MQNHNDKDKRIDKENVLKRERKMWFLVDKGVYDTRVDTPIYNTRS